jgi:hypothetical protein
VLERIEKADTHCETRGTKVRRILTITSLVTQPLGIKLEASPNVRHVPCGGRMSKTSRICGKSQIPWDSLDKS